MSILRYILDSNFRSNPRYELIEWNHLSQPEQQSLAGLCEDEEAFGIFRPLETSPLLSYKVAYKEVALLFYVLQHPSVLPAYTRIQDGEALNQQIARLVMEGILEIKGKDDFVSGAAAHDILYTGGALYTGRAASTNSEPSFIGNLSLNALRYIAHLSRLDTHPPGLDTHPPGLDIRGIASRLYCFNTIPTLAAFPTDVQTFLKISDEASCPLARDWNKTSSNGKWLSWFRKGMRHFSGKDTRNYKMYISPIVELLPETFQKSIGILSASKAFSFKVGNDYHGLLRPDKMVVYFSQQEYLLETAAELRSALAGITPQGVPFTAQLDDTGLLSWGVDPPGRDVLENFEGGSWRARITERLAAAIVQAAATGLQQQEIVDYALNRIGLEGIDTHTWIPEKNIWNN